MSKLFASDQVFHQYFSRGAERSFELEDFLYLSISSELLEYKFSSTRDKEKSDFILLITYRYVKNTVNLELELVKSGLTGSTLATALLVSPVDSTLRQTIANTVSELMSEADLEQDHSQSDAAVIKGVFDFAGDSYKLTGGYLDKEGFLLEGSIAPGVQFYTGKASDYFSWGLNGRAGIALLLNQDKQILSLGLSVWGSRGFNNEDVTGPPLYLSTGGVRLMWAYKFGTSQYIGLYGEGGIAPLFLVSEDRGFLIQTCPYAQTGLDLRMLRMGNFYLDLDIGYKAIFEAGMVLTSIEPSISMDFKL